MEATSLPHKVQAPKHDGVRSNRPEKALYLGPKTSRVGYFDPLGLPKAPRNGCLLLGFRTLWCGVEPVGEGG